MDKIFIEENKKLQCFLDLLNSQILELKTHLPYPDVTKYSVGSDWEEIYDLRYKKEANAKCFEEMEYYNSFLDSPYFARLDFEINKEKRDNHEMSLYIGKKGCKLKDQQIVHDWRSPIGQTYYVKDKLSFNINEHNYILLLRRALKITNSELRSYNDEYVYGYDIFKEGISDPFLINVLRDRRKEKRLTDIIRTIQQNQNSIIQAPLQESFIVQGCAGSGKTMILLHRLSYLKYNNKALDLSRIFIITPSEEFSLNINELANELELERIDRKTITEYYLSLLQKYDEKSWKRKQAFGDSDLRCDSFISELYSESQMQLFVKAYDSYNSTVKETILNNSVLQAVSKRFNCEFSFDETVHLGELFLSAARNLLSRIFTINQQLIDEHNNKIRRLQYLDEKIDTIQDDSTVMLLREIHHIQNKLITEEAEYQRIIKETQNLLNEARTIELNSIHQKQNQIRDVVSHMESDIANTSIFRLQKRRKMKAELKALHKELALIDERHTNAAVTLEEEANQIVSTMQDNIQNIDLTYSVLKHGSYGKQLHLVIDDAKNTFQKIDDARIRLKALAKNESIIQCQNMITEKGEIEDRLNTISALTLSNEETAELQALHRYIETKTLQTVFRETIGQALEELETKHQINNKRLHTYHLFCYLLFYYCFKGRLAGGARMLIIDEGQDLAPVEFKLLRYVNGENLVMNVYGDLNQLINPKGITDWKQVKNLSRQYHLNENYRNTSNITQFCNSYFGTSNTAIGMIGEDVFITHEISDGEQRFEDIIATGVNDAVCIFKNDSIDSREIKNSLEKIYPQIKCIPVEKAKGLEFDTVIVLCEKMTANEKYIAFTRALNNLIVIEKDS